MVARVHATLHVGQVSVAVVDTAYKLSGAAAWDGTLRESVTHVCVHQFYDGTCGHHELGKFTLD